ncbi:MAG TPA: LysR family transcriptional regulator [Luteibacter sp.]|uniref:LysR family transcriptional regulator n=1 Tax=Luteibacter sp. TaxID=1886636 RepID=UPI002C935032|nr:LysR family transcriptional regulator [Luteibacter sp.]HVI57149.1 LysR family transcriptional regulator [Luteibacter sp.]
MDLLALADFDAVALHGGFGAASRATARPKATLSRRVRELEDALGVRLIERGARPFRLTEEGATLHSEAHAMLGRLEDVAEGLVARAGAPHGTLRVSAPVLFAHRGLGRLAARFAMNYPAIHLEVVIDDRFVDPLKEGFDVVIRANPAPSTELAGRCFLRDRLVVAAGPSLPVPEDGDTFPAIVLGGGQLTAWRLAADGRARTILPREVIRLSSMALVYDAVREGIGAAMMPASLIQEDIANGTLTAWGGVDGRTIEVWALYPPQRHVSGKVSAFVGMLVDHFHDASPTHFRTL